MSEIRFCKDCKYSEVYGTIYCINPLVIERSPAELAASKPYVLARYERTKTTWLLDWGVPCGRKGKLWEPKT